MDESKTREERIKELLDKPAADVVNGLKGPSLSTLTQDESNDDKGSDEEDTDAGVAPKGDKKVRVRASRLNALNSEIETLKTRDAERDARMAALEAQLQASRNSEDELPDWWKEAYGDTDVSKQGYKNQQRIFREEMTREFERREAAREAEEAERAETITAIEKSFDDQMDELEEEVGRELTSTQKAELLDIVGEYSPTDGEGRYLAYMPVSKAYELWQNNQKLGAGKKQMADIAGAQSSGNANAVTSSERPQWGDWRKRFGA